MAVSNTQQNSVVRYIDTRAAYDAWSEVYDTDGNFLQALDTIEMKTFLPRMLSLIDTPEPWKIVDLGCGTGRNTIALLNYVQHHVTVSALDLSAKMLEVAKTRLDREDERRRLAERSPCKVHLEVFDMLTADDVPLSSKGADAIVSTLVVEHVPLDRFFGTAAKMLKPGGLILVTNMHSHMGDISQAGFVDPQSGEKIRPKSYSHTVAQVGVEAQKHGFEIVGQIHEVSVDDTLAPQLGSRATKWIGVTVWFGGIFRKLL